MKPWCLTATEWQQLGHFLRTPPRRTAETGRPRIDDDKAIAEACLYRHYHCAKSGYRCFGWNRLPKQFGISPSTANRRFRAWSENGTWNQFWHALLALRDQPDSAAFPLDALPASAIPHPDQKGFGRVLPEPWTVDRTQGRFPVGDIVAEIERAYLFFNAYFFGKTLPSDIAIAIERARTRNCRGYFCARVWKDGERKLGHIALHSSIFSAGPESALAVLLHEMVHLRNNQVGVRDCHLRNQYHNRYFRDLAHLAGLGCGKRDLAYGYALTSIDTQGKEAIAAFQPQESLFRWEAH